MKALLLDLDGTLAETEELHREAFNRTFAQWGLPLFWDQAAYARLLRVPGGKERIAHALAGCPSCPSLAPEEVARLHREKNEAYAALLRREGVALRPGVRRLLEEAKEAGVLLGLCTTASPESALLFLEITDLSSTFDLVLAGEVVPRKKPDPSIYLLARAQLGLGPGEGVVVEDSESGLQAALGAALPVVVTPSLYTQGQDFRRATALLAHLGEPSSPALVLQGPWAGERVVVDLAYLEEVRRWWST